jgi:hypothetical protein
VRFIIEGKSIRVELEIFAEAYLLVQPCQNRPAEFARTSLSALGLPTPIVALACIGNVDIQVLSCADGEPYFLRRFASWWRGSPAKYNF